MAKGIKETKELLRFVFSLTNAIKESYSDGDLDFWDAKNFVEPLSMLGDALDNIDEVLPELQDLDENEISELVSYVLDELGIEINVPDIPDAPPQVEVAKQQVMQALDTGKAVLQMVKMVKG
jgi:hypothetical protein